MNPATSSGAQGVLPEAFLTTPSSVGPETVHLQVPPPPIVIQKVDTDPKSELQVEQFPAGETPLVPIESAPQASPIPVTFSQPGQETVNLQSPEAMVNSTVTQPEPTAVNQPVVAAPRPTVAQPVSAPAEPIVVVAGEKQAAFVPSRIGIKELNGTSLDVLPELIEAKIGSNIGAA